MIAAEQITEGSWSARWHNHVVHIRDRGTWWTATVWSWPQGRPIDRRVMLDQFDGFVDAQVAIAWACDVLVSHGASVLIDGKKRNLADVLAFSPAPELAL